MAQNNIIERYWQQFLAASGRDRQTRYYESFAFGSSATMADELLALVLQGKKTATSSSLLYYQVKQQRPPQAGDLSIVTDSVGQPRCVIETTATTIMPFREMTFEICRWEGEDENLQSWQEGHQRFFTAEGAAEGYQFTGEMPVIFEDFQLVYR
jgi:uncharacterized protein YhfF